MPIAKSVRRNRFARPVESLERRSLLSALTPDETFGDGGQTLVNVFGKGDVATEIAVQADGKIVVAGLATKPEPPPAGDHYRGVIARFNADGSRDLTFGNGGGIAFADSFDRIDSLVITGDGKILVGGERWTSGDPHAIVVARFTGSGLPDTTFGDGNDGVTEVATGVFNEGLRELAIAPDGKIVGVGIANADIGFDQGDFGVIRFNADGTLDTTFGGGDGVATTDFSDAAHSAEIPNSITFSNGKLLIAGATMDHGVSGGFAIAQYNDDGSLDTAFGDDGLAVTRFDANAARGWADWGTGNVGTLLVAPDGKLVAVGYSSMGELTLARYNADGSVDASFGDAGFSYHAIESVHNTSNWQARLRTDGDIEVGVASSTAVASGVIESDGSAGTIATGRLDLTDTILTYEQSYANDATWDNDGNLVTAGHAFPGTPPALGNGGAGFDQADLAVTRFRSFEPAPPPPPPVDTVYAPGTEPVLTQVVDDDGEIAFRLTPATTTTPLEASASPISTKVVGRTLVRGGSSYKFKVVYSSDQPIDVEALEGVRVAREGYSEDADAVRTKSNRSGTRVTISYVADLAGGISSADNGIYFISQSGSNGVALGGFEVAAKKRRTDGLV